MRHSIAGFITAAAVMVFATPLVAQQVAQRSTSIMLGPFAGLNYTTVYGSDASGADSRTDFTAGGQLDFNIYENGLFRTGLVYSRRGFKTSDQDVVANFKFSYLEVPLLLGYRFPTTSGARPYVFGGANVALKVGCSIEASGSGQSASESCDNIDPSLKFSSTDVAAVAGGGVAFPVRANTVTVDLRYALGLQKVEKSTQIKNKGLTLGFGFMVPVGR
jgi:hypothetical protein